MKKSMLKKIGILMSAVMCVSLAGGCGKSAGSSESQETGNDQETNSSQDASSANADAAENDEEGSAPAEGGGDNHLVESLSGGRKTGLGGKM